MKNPLKKPYQTYNQRKLEELAGPDPETARARRSEAAKLGWKRKKEANRERRLTVLVERLEAMLDRDEGEESIH